MRDAPACCSGSCRAVCHCHVAHRRRTGRGVELRPLPWLKRQPCETSSDYYGVAWFTSPFDTTLPMPGDRNGGVGAAAAGFRFRGRDVQSPRLLSVAAERSWFADSCDHPQLRKPTGERTVSPAPNRAPKRAPSAPSPFSHLLASSPFSLGRSRPDAGLRDLVHNQRADPR